MPGRGGMRSTTWPAGQKPPVQRKKGSKNRSTIVKENLGLKNWDGVKSFIEGPGATKLIKEMQKLKGKDYVNAVQAMAEYVKPKLSRKEYIDTGPPKATINYSDLPTDLKKQVLEHFRRNNTEQAG